MKFNYQKICSDLLKGLAPRTVDVIKRRFGLNLSKEKQKKETLEAIGKSYGLTRERIRQIEKEGFFEARKKIKEHQDVFDYFKKVFKFFGGFKKEEALLDYLTEEEKLRNYVLFLLTVNDDFQKFSESENLHSFWVIDKSLLLPVEKVIKQTINFLKKEGKPFKEAKLFEFLKEDLLEVFPQKINKNIFQSCLEISKEIQKNPLGLYGLTTWLEINPKGIKDRAYLVLKREKTPLHFKQIASLIETLPFPCPKKVHTATVHNELIKNDNFVLVGRGLYALKEWGYTSGVVKDVIIKVLKEAKRPLSKREISERVLKERFVKENTIFLNLNDKNYFLKDEKGRYKIREA